jgi:hypothetical protein
VRSARDCGLQVQQAELAAGRSVRGVYAIGEYHWFLHSYYFYLHRLGVWDRSEKLDPPALASALFEPGHQRPVMIGDTDYRAFKADHGDALREIPAIPLRDVLLLMPGPYAVCGPAPAPRTQRP